MFCLRSSTLVLVALFVLAIPAVFADSPSTRGSIDWRPYEGEAFDGSPLRGELGSILVPESHDRPDGPTIELAFVRFRTDHPDPGPPIFFLAGGPGGSGIEGAALVATHPQFRLLEHADVIGLDQRGIGESLPKLTEPVVTTSLPFDRIIDRAEVVTAMQDVATRTADHWRRRGVDPSAYHSAASADDLDALRHALGVETIVLFGTSYGSHLGLAYLHRHGEHVARAVLTKVEGPDHTWKLPSTVQYQLEAIDQLVINEPALADQLPDLLGSVRALLDRLAAVPVRVDGDPPVVIGPLDLQIALSRRLDTAASIEALPALITKLENDDWSEIAPVARENRALTVDALALMVDCASGTTAARRRQIEQEIRDPANLLVDAIHAPFTFDVCDAIDAHDLGDDFRHAWRGSRSDVPTFFVSGTLDVRTPPSNVEAVLGGFERGAHVLVENAGHEARELMAREYRELLQAFLRGESVGSTTVTLPRPLFALASE
ncbi:MAG: alpha/beta fold hydrolase [Acidobacteriota bacterium]